MNILYSDSRHMGAVFLKALPHQTHDKYQTPTTENQLYSKINILLINEQPMINHSQDFHYKTKRSLLNA